MYAYVYTGTRVLPSTDSYRYYCYYYCCCHARIQGAFQFRRRSRRKNSGDTVDFVILPSRPGLHVQTRSADSVTKPVSELGENKKFWLFLFDDFHRHTASAKHILFISKIQFIVLSKKFRPNISLGLHERSIVSRTRRIPGSEETPSSRRGWAWRKIEKDKKRLRYENTEIRRRLKCMTIYGTFFFCRHVRKIKRKSPCI